MLFANYTTFTVWVKRGYLFNPDIIQQFNTLAAFLSLLAFSVHYNLSLCLPSNLPTHPCVSVSVCMPVSLHESPLSWLSGVRCLQGRRDHEGICFSHINVWYCQSRPQWTTLVCPGVSCLWWQRSTVFDTTGEFHHKIYYSISRKGQKHTSIHTRGTAWM